MTSKEDFEPLLSDKSVADPKEFFIKLPTIKNDNHHWSRKEKYVWFFTLLFGTTAVYACRTTMPLVSPSCAKSLNWSKTEVGTVLSSFFWGYTLTQILGGYLSDRFGAERVLLTAGLVWGLLTFWFQNIIAWSSPDLRPVVFARVLLGAAQGVHFPALASISSRNLNSKDRSFFFSATTAGGALGTLLTGTVGSYMNETFGWPSVFYTIGFIGLSWVAVLKLYAMNLTSQKRTIVGMASVFSLSGSSSESQVPWLTYLKSPALWACVFCHFCQNNCFFILLSWLPTYFHDNFPEARSWIFNVVPWLLMVPGIGVASYLTNKLTAKGYSVASTRKISEATCMITEALCLICIGALGDFSFSLALLLMTVCLFFAGFHNSAVIVNPQDLAPDHSGSVFGIMNAVGAIPGTNAVFCFANLLGHVRSFSMALFLCTCAMFAKSFHNFGTTVNAMDIAPKNSGSIFGIVNAIGGTSGFIGVYLAGHILELTGSWSAVFNVTALINFCGISVFAIFGSATPIV